MARSGAKPGDWKTLPFPAIHYTLPVARSFSADEMQRLRGGMVPERMEERWFVVWDDDALWMYRSWTGACMFRVRFMAVGDRFEVAEVLMNRNPEHRGDDDQDRWMLDAVFDELLRYAR